MTKESHKRHHFLSQFYLRGFCTPNFSGHTVNIFHANKGWHDRPVPVKKVAAEDYLYTYLNIDGGSNNEFEHFLAREVESPAAPAISRILTKHSKRLCEVDRKAISKFLAFAALRTPTIMENVRHADKHGQSEKQKIYDHQLALEWFCMLGKPAPQNPVEEMLKGSLIDAIKFKAPSLASRFYRYHWTVVTTEPINPFITTDWPVFARKYQGEPIVCFPLSSTQVLALTQNFRFNHKIDVGVVREINLQSMEKARRHIICCQKQFPGDEKLANWPFYPEPFLTEQSPK